MERNRAIFESRLVVKRYAGQRSLQKPEVTILCILREELPRMRVLDIGVGAGRTTRHLAGLVRSYVGIDYSRNMIAACRRAFADRGPGVSFEVCDARDMSRFSDGEFDLVLASFNSLDSIDHESRLGVLAQIRRLLVPRGYFCFSTHNIRSLTPGRLDGRILLEPLTSLLRATRYLQIRLLHPSLPSDSRRDHAVVHELARHRAYYVKPEIQLQQLAAAGFDSVRAFALKDGREIAGRSRLQVIDDKWIYFLCRREL